MSTQHTTTHRDRERTGEPMERVSFRASKSRLEALDALVDAGAFPNRSAAIRAAIGQLVTSENTAETRGDDGE
ncbi:ribbon-helix-helix domain-containing protein [Natrinema pallidum]|uniref:CopG-like domain-containing protein DNA-binding domain n=1 Tax=Natrinema pallidum DSM 3751 TaxID=1227495 RepID=L9YJY7_9EURY|nr:ribbon-helix-helix domain-containing protein [Natrinema pallidum]ELY73248.1 CopG-like domain-containing protein DNA-binding domain [Natrinema pallidum DSM 3751]